jgi:iron complex outermembrane receptor protein
MTLKSLTRSTALAAIAVSFAAPAFAQDAGLDVVISTAQKREQNVQDVPLSVATVPTETLDAYLIAGEDVRALATRVPGLYAESSNGRVAPRFYIRGLGNTDFDLAASQPVSVVMDGIVKENVILKSFPIFDQERVEVLRGPQGTLFGRNTPAGIVKFDSVTPGADAPNYVSASFGTFNSTKVESAIGGTFGDKVAVRASGMYSQRDDYIDNGFTGENDVMGGFDDIAGRLQVLLTPNDRIDLLLNVHSRELDATASLFRANILSAGSNDLNENFDRDRVFFDEGDNNPQSYSNTGYSATLNIAASDTLTFTSITGYETANGSSLGDIDGGSGAAFLPGGSFPGNIPFNSATLDGVDELDQITQEFRLTSDSDGPWNFQAGLFFFDSELEITTNPFFAPATTVRHENNSFSLFGQVSVEIDELTTLTGGLRYTDDEKTFEAVAANFPVDDVKTSDEQVSYDLALARVLTDDINVYARIARGFRAPTIQGRDVAFFGAPTTADSETIDSYEVGFKSLMMDNRLRLNGALYYYDANDLQFSAIGGLGNFNQLVNADGRGYGVEADVEYAPTDNFDLTAGFAWNNTKITEDNLLVAPCGAPCSVLDPVNADGLANVEGNPFPQAPEFTFNVTARYGIEMGNGNELYGFTDWAVQGDTNFFLYESAEFNSNGNFEGGLRVGYLMDDGKYDVALFARNITNEANLKGGIDFNNLTGFVNEPRVIGVAARANF